MLQSVVTTNLGTGSGAVVPVRRPPTRRNAAVLLAAAVAVSTISVGIAVVGFWSPVAHWSCDVGAEVAHQEAAWLPVFLLNSPYGGSAAGQGILYWTYPGAWNGAAPPGGGVEWIGEGTQADNGTAAAVVMEVNFSVYRDASELALGPGPSDGCQGPYSFQVQPPAQYAEYATSIGLPSNLTDSGEADYVVPPASSPPGASWGDITVEFSNGFSRASAANISTCGSGPLTRSVTSYGLPTIFSFDVGTHGYSVSEILPFAEQYTYTFPAGFGSWQVENLSTPGGPGGGGWAFSYAPCS